MRRIAVTTLMAVVALVLGALPAAAAVSTTIQSPTSGQEITGSTSTQVRVQRELFDPSVSAVELRLVRGGTPTTGAALTCVQGCGSNDQTWGQLQLQPNSPDEFGINHPLANGAWTLQSRWRDGNGAWSGWGGDVQITVSVPPSPVSGLAARADLREVTLTWQRAPEPDISAYRIQRRPEGGSWAVVHSADPGASSYAETVPSAGTYEYRVVTVRPDGSGGALTATSSSVSVTATSPQPSSSPTSSDGGDTGGGTTGGSSGGSTGGVQDDGGTSGGTSSGTDGGDGSDGSTDGGTQDGGTTDPTEGSTEAGGTTTDGTDGEGGSSTRSYGRSRVAPPPGVRQGSSFNVDANLPDPEVAPQAEERYFGEGEDFSEELEYGAVDPVLPEAQEAAGDTVLRRIPGGIQEFIVTRFEIRTFLTSIAAGLLFVTLGLHVYRWMRATAHD